MDRMPIVTPTRCGWARAWRRRGREPQAVDRRTRRPFDRHARCRLPRSRWSPSETSQRRSMPYTRWTRPRSVRWSPRRRRGASVSPSAASLSAGPGAKVPLACSSRVKPKPPMRTTSTLPTTSKAGMTPLQESGVRNTRRFKASRRRRTSDVRAMASPWTGDSQPPARPADAEVRPYDGHHRPAGRRPRHRRRQPPCAATSPLARNSPGQRVEPEQDRDDMGREVPGKIMIPRVRQLVGEDRPQVVGPQLLALPFRQEQDRTPVPGQAGRRDVRRPA